MQSILLQSRAALLVVRDILCGPQQQLQSRESGRANKNTSKSGHNLHIEGGEYAAGEVSQLGK